MMVGTSYFMPPQLSLSVLFLSDRSLYMLCEELRILATITSLYIICQPLHIP
jgi:hypothetical protein